MEGNCRLLALILILCEISRYINDMITEVLLRAVAEVSIIQLAIKRKDFFGQQLLEIYWKQKVCERKESVSYSKMMDIMKRLNSLNYHFWINEEKYLVMPAGFERYFAELLQNPNMTISDKMCFQINRLASFSLTREIYPVSSIILAKEGFYYMPERNTCKCAFCGVENGNWRLGDNATEVHQRLRPECPFLYDRTLPRNVPMDISSDVNDVVENLQSQERISQAVAHHGYVSSSQPLNVSSRQVTNVPKYLQYEVLENRQKSFANRWPHNCPDADRLAKAGFFFTGKGDLVRCAYCGLGLCKWNEEDDPWMEHANHAQNCYFVLLKKGKSYVELVKNINMRSQLGEVTSSERTRNGQGGEKYNAVKYRQYTNFIKRASTFSCWQGKQDKCDMAKAGFFYEGDEDIVKCFYCGICLRDWEDGDDPYREHARWSVKCQHIIDIKGQDYVNQVISSQTECNDTIQRRNEIMNHTAFRAVAEMKYNTETIEKAFNCLQQISADITAAALLEKIFEFELEDNSTPNNLIQEGAMNSSETMTNGRQSGNESVPEDGENQA